MSDWKDDIEKYKGGELTPAQMHELEKKALFDPFLADALEGIENVSADELSKDLDELNEKVKKHSRPFLTPLRIAASIVILIGVGLYFLWPDEQATKFVQKENKQTPSDTTKISSPKQAIEEPKQQVAIKKKQSAVPKQQPVTRDTVLITKVDSIETAPTIVQNTEADVIPATITSKTITGKVTSADDGLPIPGVNVMVKGEYRGAITDIDGNYTIDVPANDSLVFSFIGMSTSEVPVGDLAQIDLKMKEDVTQLNEVVVTRSNYTRNDSESPVIVLAEPVGGIKAYDKYMEDNLRYPQQALDANVKGRVVVEFNVGVNGSISNFVVMRSLGYGCDEEVIRLVKEGPAWRPTTEDSKAIESNVRVRMKFDAAKQKARKK